MIPPMKQMPEWKGIGGSANESIDNPFNQLQSQTSWASTGCKQPLYHAAWEEAAGVYDAMYKFTVSC